MTDLEADKKLDDKELFDYLKNEGQWNANIVTSNKPNIEQILTGAGEAQPTGGKGKAAPAKGGKSSEE